MTYIHKIDAGDMLVYRGAPDDLDRPAGALRRCLLVLDPGDRHRFKFMHSGKNITIGWTNIAPYTHLWSLVTKRKPPAEDM